MVRPRAEQGSPLTEWFPTSNEVDTAREDGSLGQLIERSLCVLIGQRWRYIGRTLDLTWMGFGREIPNPAKLDPDRRTGEWYLHVQCPLRVSQGARPLLGTLDLYMEASDPYETPQEFDFNDGGSLWDERVDELNELVDRAEPHVSAVSADAWGGLAVELTDDLRIQVFPWASYLKEAWSFGNHRESDGFDFVVIPSESR